MICVSFDTPLSYKPLLSSSKDHERPVISVFNCGIFALNTIEASDWEFSL